MHQNQSQGHIKFAPAMLQSLTSSAWLTGLLISIFLSAFASSAVQATSCLKIFSLDSTALTARLKDRIARETGGQDTATPSGPATNSALDLLRPQTARMLKAHFAEGKISYEIVDQLAESLRNQSAEVQALYIEETLSMYRSLSKSSKSTETLPTLSPRRLADRFLYQMYRANQKISEEIRSGLSPEQAYKNYLEFMTKHSKANYAFNDVMEVLSLLQKILIGLPKNGEGNPMDTGDFLTVGGSFFNGRADLSQSDVDVSAWNKDWVRAFAGETRRIELNSILKNRGRQGVDLSYEFHRLSDDFYGFIQPVAFRIFRNRIELLLYSPPGRDDRSLYRVDQLNFHPSEKHEFGLKTD